jgi:sugar phosphate isomerase/epimerase
MTMRQLAVQLYSVRDRLTADRAGTLRRLAEIGYRAVEPYDPLADPAGFRALTDELGLSVCSTHAPVLGDRRDELPAALAIVGTDSVIVPAIRPDEFADADGVDRTARRLNETAAWAAGHGLRLGYHNHWWELACQVDGRSALEALAQRLSPEVFLEVDVYWASVGGVDVPELLSRLGDRVEYLHVKDGPSTKDDPMTAVGAGILPIPDILAAAPPDAWRVVELDHCATDMLAALADSYAYVTELEKP